MRRAVRAIVFKDNALLVIKRDKFGAKYCTLPGGGIDMTESPEQALVREMAEETGLQLGSARLVFVEEPGQPWGTQYIYLVEYRSGEPTLSPQSIEASINELGKNTYMPAWLPLSQLAAEHFVSERLKQAILEGVNHGFPETPVTIA